MYKKLFQKFASLFLALAMTVIATGPQPARAAGSWYVAPAGDDSNDCLGTSSPCATINGAIGKASSGDTVNVAVGTYTGTGDQVVLMDKSLTLSGGWDISFTTQSGMSTIDGESSRRGITVDSSNAAVIIEHFTIQNGFSGIGGGGGILNNGGTMTISNTVISANSAGDPCCTGGSGGGGILNGGTIFLNNSTVSGNTILGGFYGSGILNVGTMTITNSTISGNTGDAIYNDPTRTIALINSTVSGHTTGGIFNNVGTVTLQNSTVSDNAIGMYNNGGTVILQNSILAGNSSGGIAQDCIFTISSSGYNIIGDTSTNNCDFSATTGDMTNIDPFLGPLQDNGGPTFTHSLLPLSLAIDAGNPAGCTDQDGNPLTTDQRGFARPQGVGCDIGAYEYVFTTPGPATSLAILSGNNQLSSINLDFLKPLRVVALDDQGNRISGVSVDFTAPASGPSGTFADTGTSTTTVDTDAGGVATTTVFTANDQTGAYTVSASSPGLGSVNFNLEQFVLAKDNFADAPAIIFMPFRATVDITDATNEPDEPQNCVFMERTVWYSFTPTETMAVRADALGGDIPGNVNIYLSSGPGFGDLGFVGCSNHANAQSFNFNTEAGQTYYLQAGSAFGEVGSIQINLQPSMPPANDNFADTESIDTVPFTSIVDITDATNESNEPQVCTFMQRTIWYAFTPTESVTIRADTSGSAITGNVNVYLSSGAGISDLNFIGCSINTQSNSVGFHAEAGETYYLQTGSAFGEIGSIQINLVQIFPPEHDSFAGAEAINAVPFTSTVDITDATNEAGEPQVCFFMDRTVWYAFTPAETMFVRANTQGSAINANVSIYRAVGPEIFDLQSLNCTGFSDSASFFAEAGQTYYLQVGGKFGEIGNIQVNLEQIPPPPNDDFDSAITVDALPFTNTQDTSAGTSAADDPMDCFNNGSVWYQFTPANDTTLVAVANTFGSDYDTTLAVYTGSRGALTQVPGGCNDDTNSAQSRVAFDAVGGTTYYFMIGYCCGNGDAGGGNLVFSVEEAPISSNDNFVDAAPIDALPTTIDFDTTAATVEEGEPAPTCAQPPLYTLWYAFTSSETGSVSASVFNQSFNSFFAVYSGTSLNNLTELGCRQGGLLTFSATQGETYYIQVGSVSEGSRGSGTLSLEITTAPQASFHLHTSDPSIFDAIEFHDLSFDPGDVGFQSWSWDFGDGATSSDQNPFHQYAVNGDYTVQLTVTTFDGRTASTSQIVSVRTHDVTITKVDAPDAGRVGQTKNITVHVGNAGNPDPETVTIDLYRSVPGGGFEYVTSLTQTVPTTRRGRPTRFTFQYTFTAQDAELGKVVFQAVANIDGLRDAFTQDNEMRSPVTTIRRPASYPNYP